MRILPAILLTLTFVAGAHADDLASVRHDWARLYYGTPQEAQVAAFPALVQRIDAVIAQQPEAVEPLIAKAIILSTYAEAKGSLDALSLVEAARDAALAAAQRDTKADDAGAYTVLGVLYYKVPGWPIGFGSNRKARDYLERARAIAPDAIDVNYFSGDFMLAQGDPAQARRFLEKALAAPPRPGRADEDAGRRQAIQADLAKLAD